MRLVTEAAVERREHGLSGRERVVVRCVISEPATLEQTRQAPRDLPRQAFHLGVAAAGRVAA